MKKKQENVSIDDIEQLLIEEEVGCVSTLDFFDKPTDQQISDIAQVFSCSFSVTFGILLTFLNISINLHLAGLLQDENILAGIGLCTAVLNCFALFLTFGLNQGFGSLSARAYGSNSIDLMKSYYNKGVFTVFGIVCYLIVLSLFLEQGLTLIGQDEQVSHCAWIYFVGILPGIACMFYFDLIRCLFNAQGIFDQPMYMQFFSLVIQYILGYVLVNVCGYEFTGIILATNVSYFSLLLMIVIYARQKNIDLKPHFHLISILNNYKNYIVFCLNFSLPNVIDSFCFEINSMLVGSLKDKVQFSAHVIYCNLGGIFFSFALGAGGAFCTLISNAIGENDYIKAKNYFKISYFVIGIYTLLTVIVYQVLSEYIAHLYTNDMLVVDYFIQVLNLHKLFLLCDYLQGSQSGIMKALGEGRRCIKYFVFSFYLIGNSLSYTLGIVFDYQLVGFWFALMIAILVILFLQTRFLLSIVWKDQIKIQYQHILQDMKALEELVALETIQS